tara:strand:- start:16788 stop:17597 length:810 start_codon:yes stop_codon:yes gene_type:complete
METTDNTLNENVSVNVSENKETNKETNSETKKENSLSSLNFKEISVYNIISGNIFQTNICNKITDFILFIFAFSGFTFGIVSWFFIDNITGVGYILTGTFSTVSLCSIRRMRLRAALQNSVNVLKEENEELKENNEDLKENIDELEDNIDSLENIQKGLSEDLNLLKETIGIFGENSDEIIDNLKTIYNNLKHENEIHSKINKNSIYLHILNIIKHYDRRSQFLLTKSDLEKAKETLLNAFPNLDYEELTNKITNNRISATNIIESIKL